MKRGEHTLDWLARSTWSRASACRDFLNRNLAALPPNLQPVFSHALTRKSKWSSAFFELIVARFLQVIGASIEVEQINAEGKRPDFLAVSDETAFVVEAVSPVINASLGEEERRRIPLLDFIEANAPEGWYVSVRSLPRLGPNDSKRTFRTRVLKMLAAIPSGGDAYEIELAEELSEGIVRLHLWPAGTGMHRLASEPALATIDNTEQRIRYAVQRKRSQVRSSYAPVLLAINATGIGSDIEDFDRALFGRTYSRVDWQGNEVERGFEPDGVFMNTGDDAPTYAGVLAFLKTGFFGVSDPILYLHPRFSGIIPQPLLQLEQRSYDGYTRTIKVTEAKETGTLTSLGFVSI